MEDGLLSLKWNNHKSTFFQVLSILREKHTYTDVTLACDGQLYQAHKFVLSTCSEYFRDIFTSTNGTSIVIVLKDVRRQDLEYLMDYMYLGQVDVAQSELPSLIKTAECLKIKGLAIPDDEPHKTQRRGADDREGSSPPSKKKRYLHEDDRPSASSSISTSTIINNNTAITSSSSTSASGRLQMEMLPPPPDIGSLVQHLRQVPHSQQPLQASPQPSPTSQGSGKSHSSQPLLLNLTTQASRTSQGGSSGSHTLTPTSTGAQSSHRPLASPSHTTPVPVIKEEAADPPETPEGYLNESFEENETKPDVSDPRHLDPDGAVPGPSGLQGSVDNWDGDGEMGGYGGGDSYPEGSLEEQGESEVQGGSWHNVHQLVGPHLHRHSNDQQEHHALDTKGTLNNFPCKRSTSTKSPREDVTVNTDQPESVETCDSASQNAGLVVEGVALSASTPSGESSLYETQQHAEDNAEIVCISTGIHETIYPEGSSLGFPSPHDTTTRQAGGNMSEKTINDVQHMKGCDGGGLTRYVCQWCERSFDRLSNLKRHLLLHSGIKPFKCLYCNYHATQKANVVQHLACKHKNEMHALLQNNINVNDILVPSGPFKR